MHRSYLLTVLSLLAMPAIAAPTATNLSFQHADWQLVCDNTRTCRAAGYTAEDDYQSETTGVSVLLTRNAGPSQSIAGQLQMIDREDLPSPPKGLRLQINKKDTGPLESPNNDDGYTLTDLQLRSLLTALVHDSDIRVVDTAGKTWGSLSDRGAAAVLLKMDEFQGRIGTPGAIMRKGTNAESSVLPAVPAPIVKRPALPDAKTSDATLAQSDGLLSALRASLSDPDDCADLNAQEEPPSLEINRLSDTQVLVSSRCWLAAYNVGSGYWIANDRPPFNPQLVTTEGNGYAKGEISADQKGRGVGDCWSHQAWTWDGKAFVFTAESDTGLCRGMPGGYWSLPMLVSEIR